MQSEPTSAVQPVSPLRRLWLALELLLMFVAAPLAMDWVIHSYRIPLFVALLPVLALFVILLLADRTFSLKRALLKGFGWIDLLLILVLFAAMTPVILAAAQHLVPGSYLGFPKRAPRLWLIIMVLYPLVSVVAQEVIYRVFFFHRYKPLFGNQAALMIFANGVLFAFGHIMFRNWISVWVSLAGGLLFAWRYHRTGSFWAVFLEHSLYGNLIFTAGLGQFFFTGFSIFR
jgi:membrane protease YdiL (CAAX protease family)